MTEQITREQFDEMVKEQADEVAKEIAIEVIKELDKEVYEKVYQDAVKIATDELLDQYEIVDDEAAPEQSSS